MEWHCPKCRHESLVEDWDIYTTEGTNSRIVCVVCPVCKLESFPQAEEARNWLEELEVVEEWLKERDDPAQLALRCPACGQYSEAQEWVLRGKVEEWFESCFGQLSRSEAPKVLVAYEAQCPHCGHWHWFEDASPRAELEQIYEDLWARWTQ